MSDLIKDRPLVKERKERRRKNLGRPRGGLNPRPSKTRAFELPTLPKQTSLKNCDIVPQERPNICLKRSRTYRSEIHLVVVDCFRRRPEVLQDGADALQDQVPDVVGRQLVRVRVRKLVQPKVKSRLGTKEQNLHPWY